MLYIGDYIKDSINEGKGLRNVIYISGCQHRCPECFSPQTWDFSYGIPFTTARQAKVIDDVASNPLIAGLTICGGDSFYSARELIPFILALRDRVGAEKDVWVYTGFLFEDLLYFGTEEQKSYLSLIDVLVDGKFDRSKRDVSLKYRGSSNQRVIDVQASLDVGHVILYKE